MPTIDTHLTAPGGAGLGTIPNAPIATTTRQSDTSPGKRGRPLASVNDVILANMRTLEMIGVVMRIFSFGLVSWMGPASPFLFVWLFNTVDAILLTWCAAVRKDPAYTLLNAFWIVIGVVGIAKAWP